MLTKRNIPLERPLHNFAYLRNRRSICPCPREKTKKKKRAHVARALSRRFSYSWRARLIMVCRRILSYNWWLPTTSGTRAVEVGDYFLSEVRWHVGYGGGGEGVRGEGSGHRSRKVVQRGRDELIARLPKGSLGRPRMRLDSPPRPILTRLRARKSLLHQSSRPLGICYNPSERGYRVAT